jgi:fucose permease
MGGVVRVMAGAEVRAELHYLLAIAVGSDESAMAIRRRLEKRSPSKIIRAGFLLLAVGVAVLIPFVPRVHSGWALVVPLLIAGAGLGLLVSQLNNYTSRRSRTSASARRQG